LIAVIQAIPLTHEKMAQTSNTYLQKYWQSLNTGIKYSEIWFQIYTSDNSLKKHHVSHHLITFAICLTLITYFESSAPGFIILVHLATCRIVSRQIRNHNPGILCVMTTAGGIHKEGNIVDDSNPNRTTYQSTTREGSSQ
jgi:hypothetical protein